MKSRKEVIQNWRCSIQLLLESGNEQNPKFGAKITYLYTQYFSM